MAENESLDLGGDYSKRWNIPFDSLKSGASLQEVARKFEVALFGGLRRTLRQLREYGVKLTDVLRERNSPNALRHLIRRTQGHAYVQLLVEAVVSRGSSDRDCLRSWVEAVFDKVSDQFCQGIVDEKCDHTFYEINEHMREVRKILDPEIERIATKLDKDQTWTPKRRAKNRAPADTTAELLGVSLVRASQK